MFLQVIVPILLFFSAGAYENTALLLTQKTVDEAGSQLVIKKNYTLGGKTITLPENTVLVFKGGKLDNGEIIGNHTKIKMSQNRPAFGTKILIAGNWDVPEVKDSWFDFDSSSSFISNQIISNALAMSNDSTFCHVIFDEKRIYRFELPYHGRADLGEMVSRRIVNGKKRRNYSDLRSEKFSFLRIFTIPSNTTVTINCVFEMLPTDMGAYYVFWEHYKENVTVEGHGRIIGDAQNHLFTTPFNADSKSYFGEWGTIFQCNMCKNFKFLDITIEGAFGDCIFYSSRVSESDAFHSVNYSSDLVIENVKIRYARRNGVVIGAKNVQIRNCLFENCGIDEIHGTQPWAAIDFEPDDLLINEDFRCENVQMTNCVFNNNRIDVNSYQVTQPDFGEYAVVISNCIFPNPVSINSSHWMKFKNCDFSFLKSGNNSFSMFTNSTNLLFEDCTFKKLDASRQKRSLQKGNRFENCLIK